MNKAFDFALITGALRRRWFIMLLPILFVGPLAAGIAYILPPTYTATARILVDPQQVPDNLASSTVRATVEQRIAFIQQRILTRENLLDVANRLNLYDHRPNFSPDQVVSAMRSNIRVMTRRGAGRGGPVTEVWIRFSHDRPDATARVANELMTQVLAENLRLRTMLVSETAGFFRQEVDRLSNELNRVLAAKTDYTNANADALPGSLGSRRSRVEALRERNGERALEIMALEQSVAEMRARAESGEFDVVLGRGSLPEEREIQRLRTQLASLRSVYNETHPAIRSTLARMQALEVAIQPGGRAFGPVDMDAETKRTYDQLLLAIANREQQIEALRANVEANQREIDRLEETIARTPEVEMAINEFDRERSAVSLQHGNAVRRLAEADVGERLEVNQRAERFEVFEQARTPSSPSSPNRPGIIAAGVGVGFGIGFAIAALLELLTWSIRSPWQIEHSLNMRPIMTIPYIATATELRRRRIIRRSFVFLGLIVVPTMVFAIDRFYMPLDVIGERLVQETGVATYIDFLQMRLSGE